MASNDNPKADDDLSDILVSGATWGGKDRRAMSRVETTEATPSESVEKSVVASVAPTAEEAGNGNNGEEAKATNGNAEATAEEVNFKWKKPEEVVPANKVTEEEGARRGMLKRASGSGTSFVLPPEPEKVEKTKRKFFTRPERLKVEKPKQESSAGLTPSDTRLIRGRAAKFSRLKVPVQRHHLAVISGAGGTGKTTTALMLSWILAAVREGGVVVLESMPGGGALAHRLGIELDLSSADVYRVADYAHKLSDLQAVTQKFDKMEVVGTDNEPRLSDLLDPGEHEKVLELLIRYYPLVISDTETGLLAPRTTTTLEYADQIVFCITTDAGAAWRSAATLNWLLHQGGQAADLARRTVVVAHEMRQGTLEDFGVAKEQIVSRCRAIVTIPFDAQFATGGALDLDQLSESTYDAYLDLAVELSHEFGVIAK